MTKIKTYKGFEIRFDTFDNKFYTLYEKERITNDKIENLEKSIDNNIDKNTGGKPLT